MDVIRFINNFGSPMWMVDAMVVDGLKSKMWVERYAESGEFKFVADATIEMKSKLPIGSFISHTDTAELMVVENHEIKEDEGATPELIITGRGLETIFEQRVVGSNKVFPTSGDQTDFVIPGNFVWEQVKTLIRTHIDPALLIDDNNQLDHLEVYTGLLAGIPEGFEDRSIKIGNLHERMVELLKVGDLGIKVVRPGASAPYVADPNSTALVIHKGVDRTQTIVISEDFGEIKSAEYLWSNKKLKNAALVTSRWVQTAVVPALTGIYRRWMFIEASDIDDQFSEAPVGIELDDIVAAMQLRGQQALAGQLDVALTKVEVTKNTDRNVYRRDFDVGDLIMVHGSYNETSKMRITEYVEIEDPTGTFRYPTLELI